MSGTELLPSRFSIGLMGALFLVFAMCTVIFQPLEEAVAFSATDDGLYYPKLAQNIAARDVCTYDGVTSTNGFHPLWLLAVLPIYKFISDPWLSLKAVYFLILAIQLVAIWMFAMIARNVRMSSAGWIAAICIMSVNIRSFTIFFSLLESPLVLLCLLSYLFYCLHTGTRRFSKPVSAFVAGVLMGICFLARLDGFLLAAAYAAVWLIRMFRQRPGLRVAWQAPLFSALGCLVLAGPYLLWNQLSFGHIYSVSSWQKIADFSPAESWRIVSSWCLHQFIPRVQYILGLELIPAKSILATMVLTGLGAMTFALTGARRRRLSEKLDFCPEFPVFVIMHAMFIILFAPLDAAASAWYWVPEILLAALAAGACLPDMRIPLLPVLAVVLVIAQLAFYPKFLARKTMTFAKLEVAEFIRENTAQNVRGAMFDSGIVSYFSQRDFIGLNGLIGDFEVASLLRNGQYAELAENYNVDIFVLDSPAVLLEKFAEHVLYSTEVKTKFENFQETPKPFAVYKIEPDDLGKIWRDRYNGKR